MAVKSTKIKISNLVKDLPEYKAKDIVAQLEGCNITGKTTSASLEYDELSALFNKLTKENQIKNLDDYINGKVDIDRSRIVVEEKPVAAKPEVTETKPETKVNVKADGEKTTKSETVTNEQTTKPVAQAKDNTKVSTDSDKNKTENKPNNTQKPSVETKKPEVSQKPKQEVKVNPEQKKTNEFSQNKTGNQNQNQNSQNGQQRRNPDKFVRPNPQDKPKQDKNNVRPEQKQEQPKKTIMQGGGEQVVADKKVRLVDTHASSLDSSKYDDKYDIYSNDSGRNDDVSKKKIKKQNNNKSGKNEGQDKKEHFSDFKKGKDKKGKNKKKVVVQSQLKINVPDELLVSEFAAMLKLKVNDFCKKSKERGYDFKEDDTIDFETAKLIGEDLGAIINKQVVVTIEEKLIEKDDLDVDPEAIERSPVVCVMGHVDHGKTSLLDAIRNSRVTDTEAGGITQSIGAYRVKLKDKYITFLDTPGHEAFGAMRARGAKATDIAILVVAADDGIMPQTVEAIKYAKEAEVSIIVAINKIDKVGAKPEEVKQNLMKYDLIPEEWGGDTICVPVSALKKTGINDLLENVLLIAELKELKANPNKKAKGVVIEASLKKGLGPTATILVQNGTLHQGDIVIAGTSVGKVRIMQDENGKPIKVAGPSVPALIVGLDTVPLAGDSFNAVSDEKMARELAEKRKLDEKKALEADEDKKDEGKVDDSTSLDDFFKVASQGVKDLNIVVKADVRGSAEAVKQSLERLSNEEVKINILSTGVGGITENDVKLAESSNAIIIGFNVRPDKIALDEASHKKIDIRTYRIIYECIDEVKAAIKGMLKPVYQEVIAGHAIVRSAIRVPNVGTIAGCYIQDGKITRSSMVRIVRDGVIIFEDSISSLKRFKDDVKEVGVGFECGVGLDKFNDIRENDIFEIFIKERINN